MLGCVSAALAGTRGDAERIAAQAMAAERAHQIVQAYALYNEALRLDPGNHDYLLHIHKLRPFAELAAPKPKRAAGVEGGHITEAELAEARRPQPPVSLDASAGRQEFDLRGDGRALFEAVAGAFGLKVVFDPDYQAGNSIHFQLTNADYRMALHALEAATNSFVIPATPRLIFVTNDSQEKRTRYERTMSILIPIPDTVTAQEIQELVAAVRGALEIQRIVVDNQLHAVLLRDKVSKVRPAEALFREMMLPRAQVELGVELLTSDRSGSLTWGFALPTSYPLVAFTSPRGFLGLPFIPPGFVNFMTFGGGASLIGIGVTNAKLFASATKSIASSMYEATMMASDGMPASLHVGSKYPIETALYTTQTGSSGGFGIPPPTFQFEDLGLSLKVTPHVHGTGEMTLDVEAEFELLGSGNLNGIPELDNTKYQSSVRLRDGQWAVVTGLLNASQTKSLNGIAGLASIPVLGPMLSTNASKNDRSETLIVIKPRLRSLPPYEAATRALWTGSEGRPQSDL
ncbi:MAG TPA: type II and III secretion system protein [Bryobacteraceae bacterium]|nr:type II and III secretion system protein [Bryobacteraceae bacterium]